MEIVDLGMVEKFYFRRSPEIVAENRPVKGCDLDLVRKSKMMYDLMVQVWQVICCVLTPYRSGQKENCLLTPTVALELSVKNYPDWPFAEHNNMPDHKIAIDNKKIF